MRQYLTRCIFLISERNSPWIYSIVDRDRLEIIGTSSLIGLTVVFERDGTSGEISDTLEASVIVVIIRDRTSKCIRRGGELVTGVCECECMIILISDTRDTEISIEDICHTIGKSELVTSICFHEICLNTWKSREVPVCIFGEGIHSELSISICHRTVDIFTQEYIVTVIPTDSDRTIGVCLRFVREGEIIIQPISWYVHESIGIREFSRWERDGVSGSTRTGGITIDDLIIGTYYQLIQETTFRMED